MNPDGILLIDKPSGPTSWDVVDNVRRRMSPRSRRRGRNRYRCGHAGTLDPLATGLLIVLCGAGTRLARYLLEHDKTYSATFRFGIGTDSLDTDGAVVSRSTPAFTPPDLQEALAGLRGDIRQIPPVISALKHRGRPMHEIARSGDDLPEIAPRSVRIDAFRWLDPVERLAPDPETGTLDLAFRVDCSSGTYIRSLARDLAEAMGTVATVAALRRERIGPFGVDDAIDPYESLDPDALEQRILPLSAALADTPALTLDEAEILLTRQGRQPDADWLARLDGAPEAPPPGTVFRMLDGDGALVAVCTLGEPGIDGRPQPRLGTVFPDRDAGGDRCS